MSAEAPIEVELLWEDENDGSSEHNNKKCSKKETTKSRHDENIEKAVQTFVEFTGCRDRTAAFEKLRTNNFNVERAVAAQLFKDEGCHNVIDISKIESEEVKVDKRLISKQKQDDAIGKKGPMIMLGSTMDDNHQKLAAKSAKMKSKTNDKPLMSLQWYACMANTPDLFVDPDFPPTQTSLDGRKVLSGQQKRRQIQEKLQEQQNSNIDIDIDINVTDIIKCVCGIPSTPRTVQSDGPNYGRFYLCCGKARDRRTKRDHQCRFFQWDDRDGTKGSAVASAVVNDGYHATRYSQMEWKYFGQETNHVMVQSDRFLPAAVRQGAIGNCWFLSALAVVAEKDFLVKQILPQRTLNKKGCYQINLCLDGCWTGVVVDSHLPVIYGKRVVDPSRSGDQTSISSNALNKAKLTTAFCATPQGQLWPALVEKAYAKVHGSYTNLSGGFIHEAFQDLTGAPTETMVFDSALNDLDSFWARLLSFHEAGFLMGVATSRGGDGLVGGHAYSVLDVIELNDMVVGGQQSMTNFLSGSSPTITTTSPPDKKQRTTIRLVRIRNPWGQKEWKGEWSVHSDRWTMALRKKLGGATYAKGDGTFFMSFHDMLTRFHHMDIVKCREGWAHSSCHGEFLKDAVNPLQSSVSIYMLIPTEKTWAFVSLVQPKKRANTKSGFWYSDISMVILKRKRGENEWMKESVSLNGYVRICTVEVFLDKDHEYYCIPFSLGNRASSFGISIYSASKVAIMKTLPNAECESMVLSSFCQIHRHLLQDERKIQFVVAPKCLLVVANGYRCLYFLAINASVDRFLSLRLHIKESQKGIVILAGSSGDTFDVPPRSQKILLVACGDGTSASSVVNMEFTYQVDTHYAEHNFVQASSSIPPGIGSATELTLVGEMTVSGETRCPQSRGSHSIEIFHWLAQIGSSR